MPQVEIITIGILTGEETAVAGIVEMDEDQAEGSAAEEVEEIATTTGEMAEAGVEVEEAEDAVGEEKAVVAKVVVADLEIAGIDRKDIRKIKVFVNQLIHVDQG